MMDIFPYTVNTGNFSKHLRTDYHCFTEYNKFTNSFRNSRYYFWLIHKVVDCDISILMHYNYTLSVSPEFIVNEWLQDYDICTFKHPIRQCVYQEIKAVRGRLKGQNQPQEELNILNEQERYYKDIGIPVNMGGIPENSIVIRRHNDIVKRFNEAMWAHICTWSYRDQIAFPIVKLDFPELKVNYIEPDVRRNKYCSVYRR